MKSTVAPYETAVKCLRIVCENGTVIRLTRYPFDLTMSNATVYLTGSGFDFSSFVAESSFAASVVDLEGFIGFAGISRDQIASGVFDGARCYLFKTDFLAPVEDYEEIVSSILGKTMIEDDRYRIEEMALIDLLGQGVGDTFSAGCKKEFGGTEFGGCKKNLAAVTVTGAVTALSNDTVFIDSSRSEAVDWFAMGNVTFTSGANAGLAPIKIKSFGAGVTGTIELYDAPYYPLEVGVTYSMVPGCRKRLEDCRDKWNNVLRFGGDPWIPTGSDYRSGSVP